MNMLNGDEAMSPAEFAKLMGAYPQPAENPLPAYGGYMDNSPANFAWVNNNAYFGAETDYDELLELSNKAKERYMDVVEEWEIEDFCDNYDLDYNDSNDRQRAISKYLEQVPFDRIVEALDEDDQKRYYELREAEGEKKNCGCGQDPCITYGAENDDDLTDCDVCGEMFDAGALNLHPTTLYTTCYECFENEIEEGDEGWVDVEDFIWDAETFEARGWREDGRKRHGIADTAYLIIDNSGSSDVAFGGGLSTFKDSAKKTIDRLNKGVRKYVVIGMNGSHTIPGSKAYYQEFTDKEEAKKHIGQIQAYGPTRNFEDLLRPLNVQDGDYTFVFTDAKLDNPFFNEPSSFGLRMAETFEAPYAGVGSLFGIGQNTGLEGFTTSELTTSSAIHGDFDEASLNYSGHQNFEVRAETDYDAEVEVVTDGMAVISNTNDEMVGAIEVLDDKDDEEMVELSIQDENLDEIASFTLDDGLLMDDIDDYLQDQYATETKKGMWVGLASLALGTLAYLNRDSLTSSVKRVFNNETQEMLENDPELIESPNTGSLDPAQYEELVVESTGYAVDVIPVGLDGSFMGSRFAALPTERYVDYNEPGIGAHTDVALNRDEMYLEPEMAMVQASESVKESEAPGQSPYNSITGEENPDFNYRVLKETYPRSLDPAVKPFIPQDMDGYTGNANTPPSVFNKMFNLGVLGQTPAFVPGSSDMGANHFGSRNATPNTLGLGGVVGGPLSDQVNANYTDGTTSMSLAQWSIENTVSQTSDTEAVVIDRSSGLMKRVRRV